MYLSSRAARSNSDGSHLAQGSEGVSAYAELGRGREDEQEKGEEAAHALSTPGGQPRIWYFINSLPSRPESHRPHMR